MHSLPEFDIHDFVQSRDTLYALSVDGSSSPSPITTAFIGQIFEVAQQIARVSPDRRLAVHTQ